MATIHIVGWDDTIRSTRVYGATQTEELMHSLRAAQHHNILWTGFETQNIAIRLGPGEELEKGLLFRNLMRIAQAEPSRRAWWEVPGPCSGKKELDRGH
jgi:hypothetical protein